VEWIKSSVLVATACAERRSSRAAEDRGEIDVSLARLGRYIVPFDVARVAFAAVDAIASAAGADAAVVVLALARSRADAVGADRSACASSMDGDCGRRWNAATGPVVSSRMAATTMMEERAGRA
jgi:hypothetical protein